jgi:hypothetical protein
MAFLPTLGRLPILVFILIIIYKDHEKSRWIEASFQ